MDAPSAQQVKRYYSRVNGARYVFADGHDCYFPGHYYDTSDPAEIYELDRLTARNSNPLIFVPIEGQIPQFPALHQQAPAGVSRGDLAAQDRNFAAILAKTYASGGVLSAADLPGVAPEVINKINEVLSAAMGNDGGETPPPGAIVVEAPVQPAPPADDSIAQLVAKAAATASSALVPMSTAGLGANIKDSQ